MLTWLSLAMYTPTVLGTQTIETFLPEDRQSVIVKPQFYEDTSGMLTIEQVRSADFGGKWQALTENYANFGYRPNPYWYRFEISNPQSLPVSQMLEISYPVLDSIDYFRYQTREIEGRDPLIQHVHTGDRSPYHQRLIPHPHFLFPLDLDPGESNTIYLRVVTAGSQSVPINLWNTTALFVHLVQQDELNALYVGVVLVIVFFNLLIYIALREKMYLYYAVSIFFVMLFFVILRARLFPLIFSDSPDFHHLLLLLLPANCLMFAALFSREFLSIPSYSKNLNTLINIIVAVSIACLAGVFVLDSQTSLKLSVLCVIPGAFLLLLLGPIIAMMGNRIAWVYTIAWGTFMFGTTVSAMSKQGFLPTSFVTEYGMQLGSALEVFILNAALAYRFYREHKDKISAQNSRLQAHEERREAELKLLQNSMSHSVTMMPNRSCFEQKIQEALEHRGLTRIAVCIIEIVRYSEISKTLGHHNTDLMLCEVARHFNQVVANTPGLIVIDGPSFEANLCSLENDSFGFLLDADYADTQQDGVNKIIRELIQPIGFKGMRLELGSVIGVAICPEHGSNAATLLRHAQVAADSSDAFDRQVSFYRPEHDQYNTRRLTIISELKEAIKNDQLELYFQPKYDLSSERVIGVEALVRWHHERYGLVRPDDFIFMAEQTGIIKPLTRWVVRQAMQQHLQLKQSGFDISMSINISVINLREDDFTDFLDSCLAEYAIEPEKICLELTETSMMQQPLDAISVLEKIRETGMNLSIDDFGSGYSSLAYLRMLPAQEIKIDKSLITGIAAHQSIEIIARTTISMCHELGFKVVAEGVEHQPVMDLLVDIQCDLIQGYLLTPPLPFNRIVKWLEQHRTTRQFAS
jgi:EAL domain-containing protein (putative c-di-GMP-specific phosphodiesterase class I)/GGDEF domain-containing protein